MVLSKIYNVCKKLKSFWKRKVIDFGEINVEKKAKHFKKQLVESISKNKVIIWSDFMKTFVIETKVFGKFFLEKWMVIKFLINFWKIGWYFFFWQGSRCSVASKLLRWGGRDYIEVWLYLAINIKLLL